MTKKAEVFYFQLNILPLYTFTDISELVSQRNLKYSDKGLDKSNTFYCVIRTQIFRFLMTLFGKITSLSHTKYNT